MMIDELRKRIAKCDAVIREEAAKRAAYHDALQLALGDDKTAYCVAEEPIVPLYATATAAATPAPAVLPAPEYRGSKIEFILEILKGHGYLGVTIQDLNRAFLERCVEKGKNLIYVALNTLIGRGQVRRNGNRYFYCDPGTEPARRNQKSRKAVVVDFLRANGPATASDVARQAGLNVGTVCFHLRDGSVFTKLADGRYDLREKVSPTGASPPEKAALGVDQKKLLN